MLKKFHALAIISAAVSVILTGCHSAKTIRATDADAYLSETTAHSHAGKDKHGGSESSKTRALLDEARSWLGVPYRYGGNDRDGVDCSGLVLQVYKRALDISLPRSSAEQMEYCTSIAKGALTPGDLVFFATGRNSDRVSHVGIFVGGSTMIHASTTKGVIESDINTPYYTRTYVGSGLVEQFHAGQGERRKKAKVEKSDTPKTGEPTEKPQISPLESPGGFRLTPVDGLPERMNGNKSSKSDSNVENARHNGREPKEQSSKTNADNPVKQKRTPVNAATTSSQPGKAEPTPAQARESVLDSLKEKKL